ncbi:MAG: response regulator [Elusimicrobia bacterium]|nr:response regulator [Elusimicrobiota bacterium]
MAMILIVEDDFHINTLLQEAFKKDGFKVMAAFDGEEAIEKACLGGPLAVILDINLPKKDGWAVLQYLKSDAKTKTIPVVIHSALDQKADIAKGLSLGAVRYLVKPCSMAKVVTAVRDVLSVEKGF